MAEPKTTALDGTLYPVMDACKFSADHSSGTIVIQSTKGDFPRAIEDLQSVDARNLALATAAGKGVGDPRINGTPTGPYAINSDGEYVDEVTDEKGNELPVDHKRRQPVAYRINVPVTRPIT